MVEEVPPERFLRTVFRLKKDKQQKSGENCIMRLHNMYTSPDITIIKQRRMKWAGHTAHMREIKNACKVLV
jgi:hypothetical protein